MLLKGKMIVESPIYRGNSRKTLFTRDGDGKHRLVSLAGEISGTAQSLMDAFIGQSGNGKNIGLLNRMWQRMYGSPLPANLIASVECKLQKESYPRDNFFDLRMGLKLDEDRWAAEANANYKMETILRNSVFDFVMNVKDGAIKDGDNLSRLYYLLDEIKAGRFWFGAGKSKGLGRLRLEMEIPFPAPKAPPALKTGANHLQLNITINTLNPVIVGWNWGKVDPQTTSFMSIEARLLIESMKEMPNPIRERLMKALGGPILSPDDWKQKFADYLPKVIAIWLREQSGTEVAFCILPEIGFSKLSKGKHALTQKLLENIQPLVGKRFPGKDAAQKAVEEALGKKANMANRVMAVMEERKEKCQQLNPEVWNQVADSLGLDKALGERLSVPSISEAEMIKILAPACRSALPKLFEQVDQQLKLIQSDAWIDAEILSREEHLKIKTMLSKGKITEYQWNDPGMVPEGIRNATWREFLEAHRRVQYRHMLNATNLNKSITNDQNHIAFLKSVRDQARQELAQPKNIDFRAGGPFNREISKTYGKPYDTMFMRMLTWKPSSKERGSWEVYIPGSTIKGAFRKRASQVLKTLWGESTKTSRVLDRIFGIQGQRGLVFFSDAYLADPENTEKSWCSMDGVKMDPRTGKPIETAKQDYLFAYGDQLLFQLRLDIQDIKETELDVVSVLFHLINDFKNGEIPIGGDKTAGFGWVESNVSKLTWLTAGASGIEQKLFGKPSLTPKGIWKELSLEGDSAAKIVKPLLPIVMENKSGTQKPPSAKGGFISHRAFGGFCGTLSIEAETLTPLSIKESGEPSFKAALKEGPVNGWDFFSLSNPEADCRSSERVYALPSRSIKGMVRHIYTIMNNVKTESKDLGNLNPVDSLFGWVGTGPNQAIMGRLSFSFGKFDKPELSWYKVPYPYGKWHFADGQWKEMSKASSALLLVGDNWRIFPHAPLAPAAQQVKEFKPDTFQAAYFRAIAPGYRARFTIRFWNLLENELKNLLWSVGLESGLGHKLGNHRYLGFGSLRLKILPDSYLVNWNERYSGKEAQAWRQTLKVDEMLKGVKFEHYKKLQEALNVKHL